MRIRRNWGTRMEHGGCIACRSGSGEDYPVLLAQVGLVTVRLCRTHAAVVAAEITEALQEASDE